MMADLYRPINFFQTVGFCGSVVVVHCDGDGVMIEVSVMVFRPYLGFRFGAFTICRDVGAPRLHLAPPLVAFFLRLWVVFFLGYLGPGRGSLPTTALWVCLPACGSREVVPQSHAASS